jgi:hypothetical protein
MVSMRYIGLSDVHRFPNKNVLSELACKPAALDNPSASSDTIP